MQQTIGEVKIAPIAEMMEADTIRVCPTCFIKPEYKGATYKCSKCGYEANHWSGLKQATADGEIIEKQRLIAEKEKPEAKAYIMTKDDFKKYVDATLQDYGVLARDEKTANNLRKLLIATQSLGVVVLIRFNDTYEERVCILTTSISDRIILKEIIPLNLAKISETMKVSLKDITEKDLEEAKQFLKLLPQAKEELLNVSDYRVKGVKKEKVEEKVVELEAILQQAIIQKASKQEAEAQAKAS